MSIPNEYLDNDRTIVNFLLRQLDHVSDLYKISLSWICSEETVNKFRGIKDSIKHNGKYYFTNGMLEECAWCHMLSNANFVIDTKMKETYKSKGVIPFAHFAIVFIQTKN